MVNITARLFLFTSTIALMLAVASEAVGAAESRPGEWDKTLKTAETEGEVTFYVVDYPRFTVSHFQKVYPKIRLNQVEGPSGPALTSRLMAERRAGKYQADLYIAGQGTHVSALYPAKALAPMPPVFILPEVKDESKWFKGFEIDEMDFGFRVAAIRKIAPDRNYVRLSQFVMPFIGCVPVGREVDGKLDGFKAVYQVPDDDHNTWRYDFFFKWAKPMSKEDSSKRDFVSADYRKLRNLRNNYLQDRETQKTVNFTGIEDFLNQDACATESMGPIADRTQEHLGASDSYVIQVRRFLLKAVKDLQAGKAPPGLVYDPAQADFARIRCDVGYLPDGVSWRTLFE